jgi:hypothetical protein
MSLTNLGNAFEEAGDQEAARATWEQALLILEQLDHPDAPTGAREGDRDSSTAVRRVQSGPNHREGLVRVSRTVEAVADRPERARDTPRIRVGWQHDTIRVWLHSQRCSGTTSIVPAGAVRVAGT